MVNRLIPVDYDLLAELADFLDGHADVRDGDYGEPRPNQAMQLGQRVQALLDAEDVHPKDDSLWGLAKDLMKPACWNCGKPMPHDQGECMKAETDAISALIEQAKNPPF